MRLLGGTLLIVALAGCLGGATACDLDDTEAYTFHFAPGYALTQRLPESGSVAGNGFSSAFLTNDLKEWLSDPVTDGLHIVGDVRLEFWAETVGTPAPVIIGGEPGEGYHFFNQFGNHRAFQPAYTVEYAGVAEPPGTVLHFNRTLAMPEGGFVVEAGDRLRVLLTSLAADGQDGSGHRILYGGDTPSQVSFRAGCYASPDLGEARTDRFDIALSGNQGLLTGVVPATQGVNFEAVPFEVEPDTQRLQVTLRQTGGPTEPKQDLDMAIVAPDGDVVWGASSPYTDETFLLYEGNLEHDVPPGDYVLEVYSYSGTQYEGRLEIKRW